MSDVVIKNSILRNFVFWGWPLLVAASIYASYYMGPETFYVWASSQTGFAEVYTGFILFLAFLASVYVLIRPEVWNSKLRWWVLAYALGVFYFMGEDQNWGQYYLNLTVPEYFLANNKEQEINLHNMSSWFNQKPRLVVEIWVILVGILVPLGWNAPKRWTRKFVPEVFWGGRELLPLAVLAFLAQAPERLHKKGLLPNYNWLEVRGSEIQELFFAHFMVLYILLLYRRVKLQKNVV